MTVRGSAKEPFARRVSELRERMGLTQLQLGRKVGVSATCVWNWESANTYPRSAALRRLAEALGTTVSYLADGDTTLNTEGLLEPNSRPSLPDVISAARAMVAGAAGISTSQVRVVLDIGD